MRVVSPIGCGRFHRAIRTEFRTDRVFASLAAAQAELDEWVEDYNTRRPHRRPRRRLWGA